MTIEQSFNKTISYYDDWMKKALPNFNEIFKTAQEIIPFEKNAPIDVLDLGAGTGLFSKYVLEKYPNANFLLYDLAEKMLDVAKERFKPYPQQFKYRIDDYRTIQIPQNVDLVISSLSIHHLTKEEKQALFHTIYGLLKKTGMFINIDQIRGETPYLRDLYWNHWLEQLRRSDIPEERIKEGIDRRITYDRDELMSDQLRWLKETGFVNVDCIYKNYFIGVFMAMKE